MLLTSYARFKYTPDEMDEKEFLERFVVRQDIFEDIYDDLKATDYSLPSQHYIIIGQRGQGKTTLLRKIFIEVQNDKELSKVLVPIKFAEEQYQIRSLCRLWEEVAEYLQTMHEDIFSDILDNMEEHFEDDDYDFKCFSYLEKELKAKDKKALILVDNIDELLGKLKEKEQRRLREIMIESSSFRIIGGSTKMLEQHFDYGKPFYEFFKIVKLQGLNKEDSIEFLRAIGKGEQKEKIELIIQNEPARIETLRRLTGGVPRTLVMLFDIFLDDGGNAFEDLLKILDEATPLYKHRMDDLPPMLQDIVHTIAINWDGMYTKEIAKKTRLSSRETSAQLGQLEKKYGIVESESVGKNKIYKIHERFFNIWYLMRFGRKKDRQRVEWLVKFLVSWCTPEELENRSKKLIELVRDGKASESYAYFMCEALSYAGVDMELEHKMNESVRNYLHIISSNYLADISSSDKNLIIEADKLFKIDEYDIGLKKLKKVKNKSKKLIDIINSTIKAEKLLNDLIELILEEKEINILSQRYKYKFARSIFLVIRGNYEMANLLFLEFADYCIENNLTLSNFRFYFIFLMANKQYYILKEILELKKYRFKDEYKPVWYALMHLMKDEFPDEIKKMGDELSDSVDEILKQVISVSEKKSKLKL